MKRQYTRAEKEFMAGYVPGHSYREIQEAFTEVFGWRITMQQVKSYIGNHGLNTGKTGRFEKGQKPYNKGKKGICAAGSEKGWFKKGHVPKNHRPVGSERVNRDGYTEIKMCEPNVWRLKHRVVWEEANGNIPKGHAVIFKDGDKRNTDINNLLLVTKGINAVLNSNGMCRLQGELKETAVRIAELGEAVAEKKRRNRLGN